MKKYLLFVLGVISVVKFTQAQITLTQSDFPTLNSSVRPTNDTVPSAAILVGTAGTGNVWDFSSLKNQNIDTVKFVAPNVTAFGNYFPTANYGILSISNKDTIYVYAAKNTSKISYIGTVFKFTLKGVTKRVFAQFTPEQTYYNFPTTQGTSLSTSTYVVIGAKGTDLHPLASFFGIDSVKVKRTIETYKNADATGTITTPAFSNVNALRVLINEINTDSIFIKKNGTWQLLDPSLASQAGVSPVSKSTSKNYQFLTNSTYYAIANVKMDTINNKAKKVEWLYEPVALSLNDISSKMPSIDLMPNPASNKVYVNTTTFKNAEKIEIYNQAGQLILSQTISTGVETVLLETIAPGFYNIMVRNNKGIIIGKNKLLVQ